MAGEKPEQRAERDDSRYWRACCPECGWRGSSKDCAGGNPIADTGDYDEVVCPECCKREKWVPVKDEDDMTPEEQRDAREALIKARTQERAMEMLAALKECCERDGCTCGWCLEARKLIEEIERP